MQRLLREGGGKLSDNIPPATEAERAAAAAERAQAEEVASPLLPMPGVSPLISPAHPSFGEPASQEVARLRALLRQTLEELETIRQLLPR